jgi:D-alanyl-D-alanine dipeptidase
MRSIKGGSTNSDGRKGDNERRRLAAQYWVEQMEAGIGFIQAAYEHPIEDACEPLVDIEAAAAERGVELEFSAEPHASGRPRLYFARPSVAMRLLAVAAELRAMRYTLVIEDAFRTYEMQRDLALTDGVAGKVAAAILLAEPGASLEVIIERLSVIVQTRPKGAGHMAGAAVDVSVRGPDGEILDRGGPYITVSEATPMDSPFVSDEARRNRDFVTQTMSRHGFQAFPYEFWHYSCDDVFARLAANDSAPARFGPVELGPDGTTSPIADQLTLMHAPERFERQLARVMNEEKLMDGQRRAE